MEKRLFALLQKAYADTRYKSDYKISQQDLLLLTENVGQIQYLFIKIAILGQDTLLIFNGLVHKWYMD